MSGKKVFSLTKLNTSIGKHLNKVSGAFWIKAEIAQLNFRSGHVYLEFVEKEGDMIVAKSRATIWKGEYQVFEHRLGELLFQVLKQGAEIIAEVEISFHNVYGLSLNILDLDDSYTIGELERKRKLAIEKLYKEGKVELQGKLKLPIVPQRLAIISSAIAAGYEDFMHQLKNNQQGYKFKIDLFETAVQGDKATSMLIEQLKKIQLSNEDYDAIIIIRGGGAKMDLYAFDQYEIGKEISKASIPVITGIGHEKDETIADIVAFLNLKTPTAVAEFLINRVYTYDQNIEILLNNISDDIKDLVEDNRYSFELQVAKLFPKFSSRIINESNHLKLSYSKIKEKSFSQLNRNQYQLSRSSDYLRSLPSQLKYSRKELDNYLYRIEREIKSTISSEEKNIELIDLKIESKDPQRILEKGYSMTVKNGRLIDPNSIKEGDVLETRTKDHRIESIVKKIDKLM
ncbi:exodeoxyribonuclease VII large subunit [Flammeovirga agarivorans]|uniref:Exodeoxyribonuclease 7 large subunit n=1 Tax=Flammeovirga agarivorans TaxID=2726742 RepID=A0A7X8XWS8_9BACT|nr:exodeoxyribonuclease VII large subunit [Flammeovirga agarivorans]NLR92566.1 exodeoxyribonuclease VII large subunit [Flammeovirga agarivorans]